MLFTSLMWLIYGQFKVNLVNLYQFYPNLVNFKSYLTKPFFRVLFPMNKSIIIRLKASCALKTSKFARSQYGKGDSCY